MSIVTDVERLTQRRVALAEELTAIDMQLERVSLALRPLATRTVTTGVPRTPSRLNIQHILDELARVEPQTTTMLRRTIPISALGANLRDMVLTGALVRKPDVKGITRHGGYWYARTLQAFDGHPDTSTDPRADEAGTEADDELG